MHEHHAGHRRHAVAREHVAQRPGGVLDAAHPAVARQGHQQQRSADQRHPQPAHRGLRDHAAVAERVGDRPHDQLPDAEHDRADGEREPRGLHALGDGVGAPPRPVQLRTLTAYAAEGALQPTIAKIFPLAEAAEAVRYLIEGRPFGRVVMRVNA